MGVFVLHQVHPREEVAGRLLYAPGHARRRGLDPRRPGGAAPPRAGTRWPAAASARLIRHRPSAPLDAPARRCLSVPRRAPPIRVPGRASQGASARRCLSAPGPTPTEGSRSSARRDPAASAAWTGAGAPQAPPTAARSVEEIREKKRGR
ncbi:unnamed protein product [Urochloa humidicola]